MLELGERVQEEWNNNGPEVYQNLIESMSRYIAAIVKVKRGYTK
jgi:hypothetical protein